MQTTCHELAALSCGAGGGTANARASWSRTSSLATNRLLADLMSNTALYDPYTIAAAIVVVAVMGLTACMVPALRASRVDPMVALRDE